MALELDTTISSLNGSNNDSNGNSTGGVLFKTNSNHSPSSNDSGFHSDRLQQQQSKRTVSRNRANIKHKPTYVSVFASDPDCSSPLFDEFNRHFAANRPNFLNGTLYAPTGDEEIRSVPSVTAPLITPSRQSISPSSTNTNASSDPVTIHPESSKRTYFNKQQPLSTSPASVHQKEQQFLPSRSGSPVLEKMHDTTTSTSISSSNGISSNANQSMQEILTLKNYKYARQKSEMKESAAYVNEDEDEKSEVSMRESMNNLYSKFQENSSMEAEVLNYHSYSRIVAKSEEAYLTLSKSTDLPTTNLPHGNSSQLETLDRNERHKTGKLCDDRFIREHSPPYQIYHSSSDSVTEPLRESIPSESGSASSPHQSLVGLQETSASEILSSEIVSRNEQECCGSANLEEPPLWILSRNPEFRKTSLEKSENMYLQEKPENPPMKVDKFISCHENLNPLKNSAIKSKDTSNAKTCSGIGKSRFVSFVPATKLNQIISQRPDTPREKFLNGNGLFSAIFAGKIASNVTISDVPQISPAIPHFSSCQLIHGKLIVLSEKFASSVFEKSYPIFPTKSIHPTRENSAPSILPRKLEYSRGTDPRVSTDGLQTITSSNEKFEKPIAPVAPRRTKDDAKPVPFNKLIEKASFFTKADNGAIPTPKTFQSVSGAIDQSKCTTMRSGSSSSVPKTTTANLHTSKKIPYSDSKVVSDSKFTGRNSIDIETSRKKFLTVSNDASISRAGNLFTKVRASFEKNAEPLPALLASHNNEKKFVSSIEENNIKVEKSSSVIRQCEKVEEKSSVAVKEKEKESLVVCSSVREKESNTKMYPSLPETESSVAVMKGLDFSRFDNVTDDEVIGRPLEADEAEQAALQAIKEVKSTNELHKRGQPSEVELMECKSLLDEKFADYDIFKVVLKRSASNPEGSIGVILSSAASGDQYISVQRVISGSIADRSDFIEKGDRVFFVQGHSTKQMSAADARTLIKQRTEHVVFVLGRLKIKSTDITTESAKFVATATADPDLFNYSTDSEEVILTKGNLGVGLALDGGRGSVFGDRPIVIKRVFEGGSAARSGRIKVGDQVTTIGGIDVRGMSYLEATKTLRSRPEGPLKLVILRRL
uniref:PDZ domain-containing protein n=1 Tax=Elaeophora elaphi TaxID=1147741 RepID=A0A0R3RQK1_9BILA